MTRIAEQFATCSWCIRCNTISLRSITGGPKLDNFCKRMIYREYSPTVLCPCWPNGFGTRGAWRSVAQSPPRPQRSLRRTRCPPTMPRRPTATLPRNTRNYRVLSRYRCWETVGGLCRMWVSIQYLSYTAKTRL